MTFQLDTCGEVSVSPDAATHLDHAGTYVWTDLSPLAQGYVEALLLSAPGREPSAPEAAREADARMETAAQDSAFCRGARGQSHRGKGVRDLRNAQDEGRRWREVFMLTRRFRDLAPETLARIIADCESAQGLYLSTAQQGAYFWLDRQVGVWGKFSPLTVTLGDDGKVRFA